MIAIAADVTRPREHGWEHDGDAALAVLVALVLVWGFILARVSRRAT